MSFTPSLPWEAFSDVHGQGEYKDVSDFASALVFRRFSSTVEGRLKDLGIEQRTNPSLTLVVADEFGPHVNDVQQMIAGLVVVAKRALSPLVSALVAWHSAVIRLPDGASFREDCIDYLFCRVCLEALSTPSEDNALDDDVAHNVESIAFSYFERYPRIGKGPHAGLSENQSVIFELYGEVLGLVARSGDRLSSISGKLFEKVEDHINCKNVANAVSLVGALHYVPISCTTNEKIEASVAFAKKVQTFYGKKAKFPEMKQALCELLGNMLAPLIDEPRTEGVKYTSWYDTVEDLFEMFTVYGKKAKAPSIVLPTRTALVCVASPKKFLERRSAFISDFLKHIKPGDKLALTSLECLYRVLLGMSVKSSGSLKDVTAQVAEKLFPSGTKKSYLVDEGCVEVVVDIINIISVDSLQFAVDGIVMGLLKCGPSMPLRMMVGLMAFESILDRLGVANKRPQSTIRADVAEAREESARASSKWKKGGGGHHADVSGRSSVRAFREATIKKRSQTVQTFAVGAADDATILSSLVEAVASGVDAVLDALDGSLGNMLMTDPRYQDKAIFDVLPKDVRPPHVHLFRAALSCIRGAVPTGRSAEELMSLLSKYTVHCDAMVRVEAYGVLQHIVRCHPRLRAPVVQEYARLIGGMADGDRECRAQATRQLTMVMDLWMDIVASGADADEPRGVGDGDGALGKPPAAPRSDEEDGDDPSSMEMADYSPAGSLDGLALLLMCDQSVQARVQGLALARMTKQLCASLPSHHQRGDGGGDGSAMLIGDVLERHGAQVLADALVPIDGIAIPDTHVLPELPSVMNERGIERAVGLQDIAEHEKDEALVWWSRALCHIVGHLLTPPATAGAGDGEEDEDEDGMGKEGEEEEQHVVEDGEAEGARSEPSTSAALAMAHRPALRKLQRLQKALESELSKAKAPLDARVLRKLSAWRNYAIVLVAGDAAHSESRETSAMLFSAVLSGLRSPADEFSHAALMAISTVRPGSVRALFAAAKPLSDEVSKHKPNKGGKDARGSRLRASVAAVYHLGTHALAPHQFAQHHAVLVAAIRWAKDTLVAVKDAKPSSVVAAAGGEAASSSIMPLVRFYNYFSVVSHAVNGLHASMQSDEALELLSLRRHESLFNYCYRWCGHLVLEEDEKKRSATLTRLTRSIGSTKHRHLARNAMMGVECAALGAMKSLLSAGAWGDHVLAADGPVFAWATRVMADAHQHVRAIGRAALATHVTSNPAHQDVLFASVVDLCFHPDVSVSHAAFRVAMALVMGRHEVPYAVPAVLNAALFMMADAEASIRGLAVRALNHVVEGGAFEVGGSGVSDTYLEAQRDTSRRLAQQYASSAPQLVAEVWKRVAMMHSGHARVLAYLPPWLRAIHLGNVQAPEALMEKLMVFTYKYGNERPELIEDLWTSLVAQEGEENNLETIASFLVNASCLLRNCYFLSTARKVAVSLSRYHAGRTVSFFAGLLFNTKAVKKRSAPPDDGGDGEDASSSSTSSISAPDPNDWEFKELFPAFDEPKLALHRSEVSATLMIELASEAMDHVETHVPMLLHVGVLGCDSDNPLVVQHSKLLVCNLAYNLARHLDEPPHGDEAIGGGDGDGCPRAAYGPGSPVSKLIRVLEEGLETGTPMWTKEDPSRSRTVVPSAAHVAHLVGTIVDALSMVQGLASRWAKTAITWAGKIGRVQAHYVYRSLQVYRALGAEITDHAVLEMMQVLYKHCVKRTGDKIGLSLEIMQTLVEMVRHAPIHSLAEHPQLFWGPMALAYSGYQEEYDFAMQVVLALLQRYLHEDESSGAFDALQSTRPSGWPSPITCQPLFLKGLTSPITSSSAVSLLALTTGVVEGHVPLIDPSEGRHTTALVALVPWMCASLSLASQGDEAQRFAAQYAPHCHEELAPVMHGYAKGVFASTQEFLHAVVPPLQAVLFPHEALNVLTLLFAMLRDSSIAWKKPLLALIGKLLDYPDGFSSDFAQDAIGLFAGLERFIDGDNDVHDLVLKIIEGLLATRDPTHLYIHESDSIGAAEVMVDFNKSLDRVWAEPDRGASLVTRCLIEVLQTCADFNTRSVPPPL